MNDDCFHTNELLQRIGKGDTVAFNALFAQYRNRLFAYLYKITKSRETAEEIVLDVFIRLWNAKESFPQIENVDAYLYRIAHNKAIDFLRSLKREPALQQQVWEAMQEPLAAEPADNPLLLKNTEAVIEEAIRQLSPQRQKVFYLHHYRHLTNGQIAKQLNLSKNTVRNHLSASVAFLQKFLSKELFVLLGFLLVLGVVFSGMGNG